MEPKQLKPNDDNVSEKSIAEIAKELGISVATAYRRRAQGGLPGGTVIAFPAQKRAKKRVRKKADSHENSHENRRENRSENSRPPVMDMSKLSGPTDIEVATQPGRRPVLTFELKRWFAISPLAVAIYALMFLVIGLNAWFGYTQATTVTAGVIAAAVGVMLETISMLLPRHAAVLWREGRRASSAVAWLLVPVFFLLAMRGPAGFAGQNFSDVATNRQAEITSAADTSTQHAKAIKDAGERVKKADARVTDNCQVEGRRRCQEALAEQSAASTDQARLNREQPPAPAKVAVARPAGHTVAVMLSWAGVRVIDQQMDDLWSAGWVELPLLVGLALSVL